MHISSFFMCRYRSCFFCSRPLRHTGRVEVCLHSFFTSALDGVEWPASHLSRFTPAEKKTLCTMTKILGGSRGVLDVLEKKKIPFPSRDSIPGSSSRWPRRYVDYWPTDNKAKKRKYICDQYWCFLLFPFENMHLSWKYKNPLPIIRQDQLGQKYSWVSKRINLLYHCHK